jgi:hypothetical protein
VADPDPPGLGYDTVVIPTFIRPRVSVPLPSRQSFAVNIDPIINPPPPVDTVPPVYPDFLHRAAARRIDVGVATSGTETIVTPPGTVPIDLIWAATYPDQFLRRIAVQEVLVAPLNLSIAPAIALELGWLPTYPDRLERIWPVPDISGGILRTCAPVVVPTEGPDCIELGEDSFGHPQLAYPILTRTQFTNESSTRTFLNQESAC